jgi:hypothetical protein
MPINYANIPGALCLLFMCSILYDRLVVEQIETHSPSLGVTAWEVVGGVLYTMVIAGFVIGFEVAMLVLLLFVAAGIPMIMGSYARHTVRAR